MTNEELLRKYYAEHDEDALAQLYEQNMDLFWSIARKSAKTFGCAESEVLDDLVSEGVLAFSEVIYKGSYDEVKGKLTTYVYPFLKGAMYRWLEKNTRAAALSYEDLEEANAMPTADNYLHAGAILSLKSPADSVEYQVMTKIGLEHLPDILSRLSSKDRYLLGHYFGAFGYEKQKVAEIAFELEMTVDGVYKAVKAAQAHAYEIARRGQQPKN